MTGEVGGFCEGLQVTPHQCGLQPKASVLRLNKPPGIAAAETYSPYYHGEDEGSRRRRCLFIIKELNKKLKQCIFAR